MLRQSTGLYFREGDKSFPKILQVADNSRKLESVGYFKEATIYIRQRRPEQETDANVRHIEVVVVTDQNQANVKFAVHKDEDDYLGEVTHLDTGKASSIPVLERLLKTPDFYDTMMKYDDTGDLRHDDAFLLKTPEAREQAATNSKRLGDDLCGRFQPAFEQIVDINALHTRTRSMTAQLGTTGLATMEMAGRFMMTLTAPNNSQITFISGADRKNQYTKLNICSYEGKEKEFVAMVEEVVSACGENGALAQQLGPKPVLFAGIRIE